VYLGDKDHPQNVFTYTPSRSRDGPMKFLAGWGQSRQVFLQAGAFGGYDGIYKGQAGAPPGNVTEVACFAHARRKFYDARASDAAVSTQALAYIRLLYDVEDQAKELAAPERQRLRQELALPRLTQFKLWLESQQASRGGPVLPKSPMGQAITYALNQWDALCVYTTDAGGGGATWPTTTTPARTPCGGWRWEEKTGSSAAQTTAATPPRPCLPSSPPVSATRSTCSIILRTF
jgi:hypothetical protein